jgi:hypothetical protein
LRTCVERNDDGPDRCDWRDGGGWRDGDERNDDGRDGSRWCNRD